MPELQTSKIAELEKLSGIVVRITFHSVETGYSELKVNSI